MSTPVSTPNHSKKDIINVIISGKSEIYLILTQHAYFFCQAQITIKEGNNLA